MFDLTGIELISYGSVLILSVVFAFLHLLAVVLIYRQVAMVTQVVKVKLGGCLLLFGLTHVILLFVEFMFILILIVDFIAQLT